MANFDHAGIAAEIPMDCRDVQGAGGKDYRHAGGLIITDFNKSQAAGRKMTGKKRRKASKGVQPVRAAVQGKHMVPLANFRIKRFNRALFDIRRIGNYQVPGGFMQVRPVCLLDAGARLQIQSVQIFPGDFASFRRNVETKSKRSWKFPQQ